MARKLTPPRYYLGFFDVVVDFVVLVDLDDDDDMVEDDDDGAWDVVDGASVTGEHSSMPILLHLPLFTFTMTSGHLHGWQLQRSSSSSSSSLSMIIMTSSLSLFFRFSTALLPLLSAAAQAN